MSIIDFITSPDFDGSLRGLAAFALFFSGGAITFTMHQYVRNREGNQSTVLPVGLIVETLRDTLIITMIYSAYFLFSHAGKLMDLGHADANTKLLLTLGSAVAHAITEMLVILVAGLRVRALTQWLSREAKS
jgi:hypothetical protein